jgi:prevent-host-death family protein
MKAMHLRLMAPRNGQRASINWAAEYELDGAVAQLGRASVWHTEGRGFESHQLHSPNGNSAMEVGAHPFRNHFGWYMQRAAAGERFLVTRRGKPYVRLIPAIDPLPGGEIDTAQPS